MVAQKQTVKEDTLRHARTSIEDCPKRAQTSTPWMAAVVTGGRPDSELDEDQVAAAALSLRALQSTGTQAKRVGIKVTHAT